jgi:aspartyl-tRNA(Asn)/glutamyl-tRNA(Gln) amidotransferase subunit A
MQYFTSLRSLAQALNRAEITACELVEQALQRASQSDSVFIAVNEGLTSLAKSIDAARKRGDTLPPLAGIPITLKDLFNVRNEVTLAGSVVRKALAKPESEDAEVVAPLREAGLLFLGRTNMSEFAFSGMGKNPHYGTPLSIWDRDTGRLPGGSSSGSAVSVAEGIVVATLGSDTAGSCRIPAAFNGIVGVKPSYGRMSLKGIYPLSPTSDAPGPLANDVDSCYLLDLLMCGQLTPKDPLPTLKPRDIKSLKLVVPQTQVLDGLDTEVQIAFDNSLQALRDSGASIDFVEMSSIDDCVDMFAKRAVVIHEAYHHHREMLEQHGDQFDPFVGQRLLTGANISDHEQLERYHEKARIIELFNQQFRASGADALLYPTVACIPPAIAETEDLDNARVVNLRCLRNTATANYFDGCSISLPCHKAGTAPVGLMVSAMNGDDEELYEISTAIEQAINPIR